MYSNYSNIFEIIILVNIFLLINVFILYPVLIKLFSKFFKKPINGVTSYEPDITIIISAYNEEKLIEDAIDSIYKSQYNTNKINILVGSDGSTDRTEEILSELTKKYKSLKYFSFDRIGKNLILNNLVKLSNTELIFFMDADLRIHPATIYRLISILSGADNGIAMSSIEIIGNKSDSSSGGLGEKLYQKYELLLRKSESEIDSNINSLGTFFGMKRTLYQPIPNEKVCDDLFIILNTAIQKKRILFDSKAITYEVREKSTTEETTRRIRLVAGGLSTLVVCSKLLSPTYGWVSYFVWNHKVLRWFSPLYLIFIAISSFFLSTESLLFYPIVISQIVLYFGAIIGLLFEKMKLNILPTKILLFIVSMNIGFLFGIIRFIKGGENSKWNRNVAN